MKTVELRIKVIINILRDLQDNSMPLHCISSNFVFYMNMYSYYKKSMIFNQAVTILSTFYLWKTEKNLRFLPEILKAVSSST